jgi:NADP-reducing hydrogenase subunit HndB
VEKIKSAADLSALREKLRESAAKNTNTIVNVSLGTCSIASGAQVTLDAMKDAVAELNLPDVEFTQSGCMCYCFAEPTVEVTLAGKDPVVFGHVDAGRAKQIVERYICHGELVDGVIPVNYEKPQDGGRSGQ